MDKILYQQPHKMFKSSRVHEIIAKECFKYSVWIDENDVHKAIATDESLLLVNSGLFQFPLTPFVIEPCILSVECTKVQ